MAVYVVLDFDEDVDAMEFVKAEMNGRVQIIYDNKNICTCTHHIDGQHYDNCAVWKDENAKRNFELSAKTVAVIKKATVFCHCTKREGWTRGRNFGWWVCSNCGHPTEAYASLNTWASFMGSNLLPPEISKEMRPLGWEHSPKEWTFLLTPKTPQGEESNGS